MSSGTAASGGGGGPTSAQAAALGSHGSTPAGNEYIPAPSVAQPASAGYMLHQPLTYDSATVDYFALLQQQQQGQQQQPRQPSKQPQHYDLHRDLADFENWDAPLPPTQKTPCSQNQNILSNVNNGSFGSTGSNADIADFAQNFFEDSFDNVLYAAPQKKSSISINNANVNGGDSRSGGGGGSAMANNLSLSAATASNELNVIDSMSNISQYNLSLNEELENSNNSSRKPTPQGDFFADFTINIISLSQEPLSAHEIIEKVTFRCNEVVTRFLPCVEFLVACQQELRAGLQMVVQKNGRGRSIFTAQEVTQFNLSYIHSVHLMSFIQKPTNRHIILFVKLKCTHIVLQNLL